jgi:Schlafen, AlbA_2
MARTPALPADLVDVALQATRASRRIGFKREFSPETPGSWCELIKDVVAIANSGGGVILVGLNDDGAPTGWDPTEFLRVAPAVLTDRTSVYVGERWDDIEIAPARKGGRNIVRIVIGARTGYPLVFEKPGTYEDAPADRQRTAFERGTVYVRHGAKSEPGLARDLSRFAASEANRLRRELLRNMRKASSAPPGSEVIVVAPHTGPAGSVERFRIVDDPNALAVARTDFDVTHPYRQKELINTINDRVGAKIVGPYEIQCVRRVYGIDNRPEFAHEPKFGTRQYSDAFVSWLVTEYQRDAQFFAKAKAADADRRDAE